MPIRAGERIDESVGREDDDQERDAREDHGDDYEDAVAGIKAYRVCGA